MDNTNCCSKENTAKYRQYHFFNDITAIETDEINSLQAQFRIIHLKTQLIVIIFAFCFEFIYYFIARDQISVSFIKYSYKYIIAPFLFNIVIYFIAKAYNRQSYDSQHKNYFVVLSSIAQTFFYISIHQLFVTIYAGFLVIIFLSTVYSDKKLTRITTVFSFLGTLLAVFVIKYDYDRILTNQYLSDFLVIIFILIITHITAEFIINSNKSERARVLNAIQEKEKYWYGMMVDDLSCLYSRAALRTYINELQGYDGVLCIVMIDLDDFKKINDTYGHLYGDEVIRILGKTFNTYSSSVFTGFRYGGEEFLIMIKADENSAREIMMESKEVFSRTCLSQLKNPDISFSGGISSFSKDKTIADIIGQADCALYDAKKTGKNKIVVYK